MKRFDELKLYEWRDPAVLAEILSPNGIPEDDWRLLADSKYKKHLETWVAARFAFGFGKIFLVRTLVKMVPETERFPDALIRFPESDMADVGLETTIVMEPNRKLQQDYWKKIEEGPGGPRPYRIPDPEEIAAWVNLRLAEKALSADRRTWLLVYLNTWSETAAFTEHVEHKYVDPWGAAYVLNSKGNGLVCLKGKGPEGWQAFDV